MTADPELDAWLVLHGGSSGFPPDVTALRRRRDRPAGPPVTAVTDELLSQESGIRLRNYRHDARESRATCVYVHGGAFVFGDLDSHDRVCRRLAALGEIDVVALDYRRAPEHPAPAAIDDVAAALRLIRERLGEQTVLGLAGDSAGALIAYLAAETARVRIDRLLLINPNVDLTLSMPSIREKGHGWGLDARDLEWLIQQWAPTEDLRRGTALNPLQRPAHSMPLTTIVTSEHDPLRDEGIALAEHLRGAGQLAHHEHLEGMVHGVITLDSVSPSAGRAGDRILSDFARTLRAAGPEAIARPGSSKR